MKTRTRFLSLFLSGALLLSLSACKGEDAARADPSPSESAGEATPSPSPASALPADFVADPAVEDLCLATAGVPGDFALFTVNGAPVTARAYLYWLAYYFSDTAGAETAAQDALDTAKLYSLVASKAQENGLALTQEQTGELESNLAMTEMMMGGGEEFEDQLRQLGLDYDAFYQLNAASYYYEQLMYGLYDEPTGEEMDAYIQENDILAAKHILLATIDVNTGESLSEEEIARKRATAEDVLARLQASGDLEADFDALMNEYSEDPGLTSHPDGYTFTAGEMVSQFEEATRALEYGQISGVVESPSTGYHIILRLDPDTESLRLQVRAGELDEQLQTWVDEADVVFTREYEALDPALFYEKFTAYQEAFAAQAEAEAEPSQSPLPDGAGETQEN